MRFSSGMNVRLKRTRWLTVARIPIGFHHAPSYDTDGSRRSHAISSSPSAGPLECRAPPGPAVWTSRIAQSAPPALVQKALLPSTIQPPSTRSRRVPKAAFSPGARVGGSPLQATHFSPFSTTPWNQRRFCASLAMPSRITSEFACPSQQRASERSAFAISFVSIQSVKTSPWNGPRPRPPYSRGIVGACRPAATMSSKSAAGNVAVASYSGARFANAGASSRIARTTRRCSWVISRSQWGTGDPACPDRQDCLSSTTFATTVIASPRASRTRGRNRASIRSHRESG